MPGALPGPASAKRAPHPDASVSDPHMDSWQVMGRA